MSPIPTDVIDVVRLAERAYWFARTSRFRKHLAPALAVHAEAVGTLTRALDSAMPTWLGLKDHELSNSDVPFPVDLMRLLDRVALHERTLLMDARVAKVAGLETGPSKAYARLLQAIREFAGFSRSELARILGVSEGAVRHIETARNSPPLDRVWEWVRACNFEFAFNLSLMDHVEIGRDGDAFIDHLLAQAVALTPEDQGFFAHIIGAWPRLTEPARGLLRSTADAAIRLSGVTDTPGEQPRPYPQWNGPRLDAMEDIKEEEGRHRKAESERIETNIAASERRWHDEKVRLLKDVFGRRDGTPDK